MDSSKDAPFEYYLGNTFEYLFNSNLETSDYRSVQLAKIRKRLLNTFVVFFAVAVLLAFYLESQEPRALVKILPTYLTIGFISLLGQWQHSTKRIIGLGLMFHPGWIGKSEIFNYKNGVKGRLTARIRVKHISVLQWVADGCWVETPRLKQRGTLIDGRLLRLPGAVRAFEEWAQVHGVKVEGVSPLPDGQDPYGR